MKRPSSITSKKIFLSGFFLLLVAKPATGLKETSACIPFNDARVPPAANSKYTQDKQCIANSCPGGCCRYHSLMLVCDTNDDFPHQPCVCNDITADRTNNGGGVVDIGAGTGSSPTPGPGTGSSPTDPPGTGTGSTNSPGTGAGSNPTDSPDRTGTLPTAAPTSSPTASPSLRPTNGKSKKKTKKNNKGGGAAEAITTSPTAGPTTSPTAGPTMSSSAGPTTDDRSGGGNGQIDTGTDSTRCSDGSVWQTMGFDFKNCTTQSDCAGVLEDGEVTCCKIDFCWCGKFDAGARSVECV